jgi:hypothetical protein
MHERTNYLSRSPTLRCDAKESASGIVGAASFMHPPSRAPRIAAGLVNTPCGQRFVASVAEIDAIPVLGRRVADQCPTTTVAARPRPAASHNSAVQNMSGMPGNITRKIENLRSFGQPLAALFRWRRGGSSPSSLAQTPISCAYAQATGRFRTEQRQSFPRIAPCIILMECLRRVTKWLIPVARIERCPNGVFPL